MVRYQSPQTPALWSMAPVRDFSSVGARFIAEYPFAVGTRVSLQLVLPTSTRPIALEARVVHAKPRGTGMVEIGVSFEGADEGARRAVAEAADVFLRQA